MSRKKENKLKLAGDRLLIARLIYGKKSRSKLLDWERWTEFVEIYNESTIKRWENDGVPESKLRLVADCFNVPLYLFTDSNISNEKFSKIIELKKENQEADITPILKSMNAVGFNWKELSCKTEALETDYVYGDRNYTLKIY